jgi:gluconolactonase
MTLMLQATLLLLMLPLLVLAEPEFSLTEDSKPHPEVSKGELIKDNYTAKEGSVFPGTQREYQIYLPVGFDKTKPAAFMVFQDGVIYNAPVVFDNLIAKKELPPLVGIFIKPGVVPAANDNALPRFNRSYEYDSVTDTYAKFLIDELLPAVEQKHGLKLSTDPNDAAISGNSSGGIAAFMVAWHRPDRFRRVFTGVGTYVGIHGADQLPVLIRKMEPKPLKVFLQSGTGDNNLYCGDWWMANQMMERSLTWAGYDVNHAWGEGGHNQKHASQIFPEVLRWLWKGWPEAKEVKANPQGDSKWLGYGVVKEGAEWELIYKALGWQNIMSSEGQNYHESFVQVCSDMSGAVYANGPINFPPVLLRIADKTTKHKLNEAFDNICAVKGESAWFLTQDKTGKRLLNRSSEIPYPILFMQSAIEDDVIVSDKGLVLMSGRKTLDTFMLKEGEPKLWRYLRQPNGPQWPPDAKAMCLSPDQTQLYLSSTMNPDVWCIQIDEQNELDKAQSFYALDGNVEADGLCVDTEGRLYVSTSLGIQVCDQAGRVNFIIPTPQQPHDLCFGGKDLSELFIACGDKIYKRPMKVRGIVSGQMPPIKPAPPKL